MILFIYIRINTELSLMIILLIFSCVSISARNSVYFLN